LVWGGVSLSGLQEEFAGGKLLLRREGSTAIITFNHPGRMNAIELEMWAELTQLVPRLDQDEGVRVLVFEGAGDRAFSAGADISRFADERSNSTQARKYSESFLPGLDAVGNFAKPTISSIGGACVGGGIELAAATDIRIAGESSRFGVPVAKLGLVAGYSELRRFVNSIGPARTLDMLLTARLFSAGEMLNAGFLAQVVPDDEVKKTAMETAGRIGSLAPLVQRLHKEFVNTILLDPTLASLTEEDFNKQFTCFDTADFKEGVDAFLAKRAPRFEGR